MLHSVLASHSQNGNSVTGCSVGLTGSALLSREALRYTPRMRATLALVSAIVAMAQTMTPAPRDLEGVWGFATLTPLERPAEFSAPFTSAAEAAAWAKQTIERGDRDRRDGGAAVDVARAVNDYWFERGTPLASLHGRSLTSMIADPPDGR